MVSPHLPHPPAADTTVATEVDYQYLQPMVHISELSRSTFFYANSVHSSSRLITDINFKDDEVSSNSSTRRITDSCKYPSNTELNAATCSTNLSVSTSHNTNSLHSASSSLMDTNSNGDVI